MYILALAGSKRKFGNSDVLLLEAAAAAQQQGAEVEKIYLSDLDLQVCKGDLACVYNGTCSTKDDMQYLIEKVVAADGLILAAPTYVLGPSGLIKTIADRGLMLSSHLADFETRVRKAVTITVAGNPQWNPTGLEGLNHLAWVLGFQVVNYLEAFAPGPGEVLRNEAVVAEAAVLGKHLVGSINGNLSPRKAGKNQCPVCFSRSWRWREDGQLECPYCLLPARVENTANEIQVKPAQEADGKHFWDYHFRQHHIQDWVIPSKDRYLQSRKEIKEKLKKYR